MLGTAFALIVLAAPQEPLPLKSFDDTLDAFIKERGVPGGALAVVKDGRLVYAKGYGWADMEEKTATSPTSLFRIASLSKPVTAVAALALARQGKLDLDARAFGLLGLRPGEKGNPRLADVTVRQLLQHTGGWDRSRGDPMFQSVRIAEAMNQAPPAGPDAILRWMLDRPLDFEPGTRHVYSNFGYCVLGRILEKASGEPYEACVRKTVLDPMGITRMRLGKSLPEDRAPDEVRYYQPDAGKIRPVFARVREKEVPVPYGGFCLEAMDAHGGWLASAVDLARFASSLDKVLDRATLETMFAPPPGLKSGDVWYGCGWMVRRVGEGKRNTWHGGSLPGTHTLLVRRHDGLTWVVLFNRRSSTDGKIDPALHEAAGAVERWPADDLFPRYR
jgi:N-acyl-D-amino-acid deacylase